MSFISVDSSTQSLAFCYLGQGIGSIRQVVFEHTSKNIYDKAGVIGKRSGASVSKLIEVYKIKSMVIEKPIFGKQSNDGIQPRPRTGGVGWCLNLCGY